MSRHHKGKEVNANAEEYVSPALLTQRVEDLLAQLPLLPEAVRIAAENQIRRTLGKYSAFATEPVSCVQFVKSEEVTANDFNPNRTAPPEQKLLELSIMADGYTMPIVSWHREDGIFEVVDGFHRHRVGKESKTVAKRMRGYLPVVSINSDRVDKGDRIAATIRHNRARGKHQVELMSDIVVELKRRNWSDEKIARELGMDADEVLRLCQITGLAEVFKDQAFSEAWEVQHDNGAGGEVLSDVIADYVPDDGDRLYHGFDKWECYRAGFYSERPPNGITHEQGEEQYREFLADLGRFRAALEVVTGEWKYSPEHYLTNDRMNRIAWLGQASVAQALGIPSGCRGGYHRLNEAQRAAADSLALEYLNKWLVANNRKPVTAEEAGGRTEAELY